VLYTQHVYYLGGWSQRQTGKAVLTIHDLMPLTRRTSSTRPVATALGQKWRRCASCRLDT
jgi:hypothetical protein